MKIISLLISFCFSIGNAHFDFPQHTNSLAKWNGGSAQSSVSQQLNPASILMENHLSLSMNSLPENISSQSFIITHLMNNYILKLNTSILDYGQLNDFITNNLFSAKDIVVGCSIKKEVKKVISVGIQFNFLNSKIGINSENIFKSGIGFRTHLMRKRLGLGLSVHKYFNLNITSFDRKMDVIVGLFYKPLHLPGEIAIDIIKNNEIFGILSTQIKLQKYFTVILGITSEKRAFHTGSTLKNIFYGLSSGFQIDFKNYNFNFGIRNIGAFGNLSGISLGYNY